MYWSLYNFPGTIIFLPLFYCCSPGFSLLIYLSSLPDFVLLAYQLWVLSVKTGKWLHLWFRRKGILSTKFWLVIYHLNGMPWEIVSSNKINWYKWMLFAQLPDIHYYTRFSFFTINLLFLKNTFQDSIPLTLNCCKDVKSFKEGFFLHNIFNTTNKGKGS